MLLVLLAALLSVIGGLSATDSSGDDGESCKLSLHAIDMSRTDNKAIQEELLYQLEHVGFLYLTNIPRFDQAKYLRACEALHAFPTELKEQMYLTKDNPNNTNMYRGYHPFIPNDESFKEFFDFGAPMSRVPPEERHFPLYEDTPFPPNPEHQWIRREFEHTHKVLVDIAHFVVHHLAEGLGKPADFFDSWNFEALATLRCIHYKPRATDPSSSNSLNAEAVKLTTPAHADSGFLTFLSTFDYPGLQVLADGEFKSVNVVENSIVVNLGETFSRMTGYRLKATHHRVLDIGTERYSSPLFLDPKYGARIPRVSTDLMDSKRLRVEDDKREDDFLFGDWLIKRMMLLYGEWRDFKVPPKRRRGIDKVPVESLDLGY